MPYAIFELTDIDAAGDPATGRMFFTEHCGESPKLHVLQITVPN